ncbi:MAG: type II toxin-antitoxin system VapC family toxin [Candidatus Obscuribacterales bacterium]|jgi:tRNA(fMet)-specific endonuclease VapC
MNYLLDTDICIAIINRRSPKAISRLQACKLGSVALSTISVAELRFGADKSQAVAKNHEALDQFFLALEIKAFDEISAIAYGAIRADLERKGTPIGPLDTLIAAQALAHELILVTNNQNEFTRVEKLRVETWI